MQIYNFLFEFHSLIRIFATMLTEKTMEKLRILAESAKYDVSCSSSGTVRKGKQGMVGSTVGGVGICHSFADDGRCISLLKVMLTNYCMYDCAYCINRRSNDIKRATLSVSELEEITMEFYRRNYIEGLFLSRYDGAPHSHCSRFKNHSSFQWLYPSEKHSWLFAGTAQRGWALCRPHECEHRDTQGRVAEAVGTREEPQERVHADEADPARGVGE